jgi:hypothetical protein
VGTGWGRQALNARDGEIRRLKRPFTAADRKAAACKSEEARAGIDCIQAKSSSHPEYATHIAVDERPQRLGLNDVHPSRLAPSANEHLVNGVCYARVMG